MIVQTSTIVPKQQGLDFVTVPRLPQVLYVDGWRFAVLYICRPNETRMDKIATPEKVKRLQDAGIGVVLNYEASGTEGRLGQTRGRSDGRWARDFVEQMGYPKGLPVMCSSFDTDVRPYLDTATAYGNGFAEGLDGDYRLGVYGGTPIINALRAWEPVGWKAMARSWSPFGFFPTIHIDQFGRAYPNGSGGYGADVNTCLTPFDVWLPHAVPDPPPPRPPAREDLDAMIYAPADAYDSRKEGGGGPLYVRTDGKPQSRTISVAPGYTRAQVVITPIALRGAGHLRWSGNGVEPDFSFAQFQAGHPPMPLGMLVDLNGDGALDVWVEGADGAACDLLIGRTHVNG